MKHPVRSFAVGAASAALLVYAAAVSPAFAQMMAPAHGAAGHPPIGAAPAMGGEASTAGKVVETMDAGQYTYVLVDEGAKKVWAAGPKTTVAVGDEVVLPEGAAMKNFHSDTLNRTFDVVYFVQEIQVLRGDAAKGRIAAAHSAVVKDASGAVDLSNIKKADGGETVAELFAKKPDLVGKDIAVRGRVVKFTPSVMGKNWIHIKDGTGSAGTDDLAVTTSSSAKVGDMVLVRGKLSTDKDFGFGYKYDLIVENANVTTE